MTPLDARCPACRSTELSGTEGGDVVCRECGARSALACSGFLDLQAGAAGQEGSEDAKAQAALGRPQDWPDESRWGEDNKKFCDLLGGAT